MAIIRRPAASANYYGRIHRETQRRGERREDFGLRWQSAAATSLFDCGQTIALCLPTGWALQALHQLISFGSGFDAVLLPLAVLVGFGAVANLLAARYFRS
jgi:hypothetical protein